VCSCRIRHHSNPSLPMLQGFQVCYRYLHLRCMMCPIAR
jgi:hypothetical protein